jgi:hypothetical protein
MPVILGSESGLINARVRRVMERVLHLVGHYGQRAVVNLAPPV